MKNPTPRRTTEPPCVSATRLDANFYSLSLLRSLYLCPFGPSRATQQRFREEDEGYQDFNDEEVFVQCIA